MHFEVNGKMYLLNFNSSEDGWTLSTPTSDGLRPVRVFDDGVPTFEDLLMFFEPDYRQTLN